MPLVPDPQRRNQGTDSDARSAQIIHLINLEHCVNLSGPGKDIADSVCGDSVQAAAKGVQLDQVQIVHGFDKAGGRIQPCLLYTSRCV